MFSFLTKIWTTLLAKYDVRILALGLPGAGKTTFLKQIKMGETVKTYPNLGGFDVETFNY